MSSSNLAGKKIKRRGDRILRFLCLVQSEASIERLERGQGVYIVIYAKGKPEGIYFAGYSFD